MCGVTNGPAKTRVELKSVNVPNGNAQRRLPEQMSGQSGVETKKLLNRKVNWNYLWDMRAACMDFQSKLSDRQSFYSANMQTRLDNKQPTAILLVSSVKEPFYWSKCWPKKC
jgi:hypothetical protein